jgi:hypothetical protein
MGLVNDILKIFYHSRMIHSQHKKNKGGKEELDS